MKPKSLLWLVMATPITAAPVTKQLSLVNEPGFNQISVKVDPGSGLSDTDVTNLTGTVDAQFEIDPLDGTVSELTLSNGRANGTSMSFARSIFLVGGYNINVNNLSSKLYTILPPGTVNPFDGQFDATQHAFDIDQGNITGSTNGIIGNNTINEEFSPASPASGVGSGTGTVALTDLGDSGNFRVYNSVVTLPVTLADTFLVGSTNVNITGNGTLKFSGIVQVPTSATVADTVWTGAVSQDWKDPFNWSNGVPQENAPQIFSIINTATGNFPEITSAGTYQGDWDLLIGGGTNGRLAQSAGTLATGETNWMFLGWQGAQATYDQTGSASLKVGGLTNPAGVMFIGLDNGTVSTWNVNTTGIAQAGSIFAGTNGASTGIINMTAGTVDVSGEMQIGGSGFWGNGGTGQLNMTGGTVTANVVAFGRGGSNAAAISSTGVISGGTLNSRQWFNLGFAGSAANVTTVTNNGGTININTSGGGLMEMGVFDATTNLFTLDSGSVNLQNNASIGFGQGGNHSGISTITQNGGSLTFFSDAGFNVGGTGSLNLGNGGSTGTYAYNLNGGTLTTPSISKASGGANGSFNFNGGTLVATGSTTTFMQGLTAANIQNGGAIIDTNNSDITIAQALLDAGTGGLTKQGAGTLTLAGANTYDGNTIVQSGGQLILADNASLRFVPGANGVNNQLGGNGAVQLDGNFTIDATSASTTIGHSWTLVDVNALAETYGSTFTVSGWAEATPGVWVSSSGPYRFTEATGVLDVFNGDVDGDGMPDSFEQAIIAANPNDAINTINDVLPGNDFDGDGTNNLTEYRLGLIPNDANSRFFVSSTDSNLNDGYTLGWQGKTGLTFNVERSSTLASASWSVIHTVTPAADGPQSFTDPAPVPVGKAFYRVTLAP